MLAFYPPARRTVLFGGLSGAQFQSDIWLSRAGRRVNAKSIMGVMMLAAGQGSTVTIEAEGTDAQVALAALTRLIAERFGEGE